MENGEHKQPDAARHVIMTAIREQLAASAAFDAVHEQNRARHEAIEHPRTVPLDQPLSLFERFSQSLEGVGGHCILVGSDTEATEAVRTIIEGAQARRVAVSDSPLVTRLMQPLAASVELIDGPTKADLFICDLGVTGAQWAIAETGTLALESDHERHRLPSLVPPVHVAVIAADRIRHTLSEVLQAIDEQGADLSRTITFITGPSRTSDIELTLAIGVHGPAELYVIVLAGAPA